MDRNLNNKVYINPNFQRTCLTNVNSLQHSNNTNSYKHCSQQNDILGVEKKLNRKIYINPNFKQQKPTSIALESHDKVENVKNDPVLIAKSKYSLVSTLNKYIVPESNYNREDRLQSHDMNIMPKTNVLQNQKVLNNKCPNGVPIVKSRYTIVRKNKMPSKTPEEIQQQNFKQYLNNTILDVTNKPLNLEIRYSNCNNMLPEKQENNKPLENVLKIKISKYKTIPVTYLKKNIPLNSDFKSTFPSHTKSELPFNKNKYKLTRPSSKSIIEANTSKTTVQTGKKSLCPTPSKMKLLKANFKVNNIPCRLFIKYGKCLRKDYGNCEYVHDKKHVSLCRKFLKGICHDRNCTLSHELTANKMPTCYFYLKGICHKENCPYLHIKLNDKIKICQNFLRGFCENGDTCQFRHVKVNQCKKSKIYNLNSYNRYKNLLSKSIKLKTAKVKSSIKKKDVTQLDNKKSIKPCNGEDMDVGCRYYKEMVTNDDNCKNIKPTRCKIGTLPSFIQL